MQPPFSEHLYKNNTAKLIVCKHETINTDENFTKFSPEIFILNFTLILRKASGNRLKNIL